MGPANPPSSGITGVPSQGPPREKPKVASEVEAVWLPSEGLWLASIRPPRWRLTAQSCIELEALRLGSMWGEDRAEGELLVHAIWLPSPRGEGLHLVTSLSADEPKLSTLLPDVPSALYFEREIAEMFGIEFTSSPDGRPLLLHEAHPFPPLRRGTEPSRPTGERLPFAFPEVEGEGIYEVPVGPVHAGIIEPGHFRFQVMGEEILTLEVRLGYTHKGTEKLFEGRTPAASVPLAESVAGDSPLAGASAFIDAVESAVGIPVDPATQAARGLLLELERVAFLLGDVSGIALDVGYATGAARANVLRQTAYGALDSVSGARTGRGALTIGGLLRPLAPSGLEGLQACVELVSAGTRTLLEHLLSEPSVVDRVHGTGVVPRPIAQALQLVGPVGRASGIAQDVRSDRPYGPYRSEIVHVQHEEAGDVEARLRLKAHEIVEGCRLVTHFLSLGAAEARVAAPVPVEGMSPVRQGVGLVESPRGELLTWVSIRPDGKLQRVHVRDPSYLNWPAIEYAVKGNIVPDFPLCNKSLNLSYSGFDR